VVRSTDELRRRETAAPLNSAVERGKLEVVAVVKGKRIPLHGV
jgi:hypothetical protein